jgi:hypothetical protein
VLSADTGATSTLDSRSMADVAATPTAAKRARRRPGMDVRLVKEPLPTPMSPKARRPLMRPSEDNRRASGVDR